MLTVTFMADEAVLHRLDCIGRAQHRSRELVLADAVAAYVEQHDLPELEPEAGRKEDSLTALLKRLHAQIPPEAIEHLPTDLAQNYKHYLYGYEKEQ